jgi:hypothetical protein
VRASDQDTGRIPVPNQSMDNIAESCSVVPILDLDLFAALAPNFSADPDQAGGSCTKVAQKATSVLDHRHHS